MRSKPKLSSIWKRVTGLRALVYGDLILDKYLWHGDKLSNEGASGCNEEVRPGGAAAVAAMVASFGADTNVAGIVGDDSTDRTLLRLLAEAKVNHAAVHASGCYSTPVIERTVKGSIHEGTVRLSQVNRSHKQRVLPPTCEHLLDAALKDVDDCDVLFISDYGQGACHRDVLRPLIAAAHANALVCVDPRRTRGYSTYGGATLLKTSRRRAALAVGRNIITREDALDAGREICAHCGFLMTVITLGSEGMVLVEACGDQFIVPTIPLEVFEPSGAREIALSVMGLALAKGTCGRDAIRLANLAAGLEIQRVGVTPVSHGELRRAAVLQERLRRAPAHRNRTGATCRARHRWHREC